MHPMPNRRRTDRNAFTLVEAVVATSITAIAGCALLLGIASSLKTTNDVLFQSLATGMAQQLMDEICGKIYCGDPAVPYQYPLGPSSTESAGVCRERYDDIDDFNGVTSQPPNDCWGKTLGTDDGQGGTRDPHFQAGPAVFSNWQRTVSVYYLNPANLSQALPAGQTSDFRAAEVKVFYHDANQGTRLLTTLRRVFTYVPIQ
jgi:type II secretory pathway pseudopilin PulG